MVNKYTATSYVSDTELSCSTCKQNKLYAEFNKDLKNKRRKGYSYSCKTCTILCSRKSHKRRIENGDEAYKEAKRNAYFKFKYKMSLDERRQLLARQDDRCAICRTGLVDKGTHTHIDHCHETGKIRAILCTNCNRGLGHFQDSVELLEAAARYLKQHRGDE